MRLPGEPAVPSATWQACVSAAAELDVLQAEAVLGFELMVDLMAATSSARGTPYSGHELALAADELLARRPTR